MLGRVFALLLTAAFVPSLIAGGCNGGDGNRGGKLTISSSISDKEIRQKLLEHTPLGTSAVEVLSFVIDRVRPSRPVEAHFEFNKAYEEVTGKKSGATPLSARIVSVIVAERYDPPLGSELVNAEWQFDENDRVTDIAVERYNIGP